MLSDPHIRIVQEAVVGVELLDFSVLHIEMHAESLSQWTVVQPVVLKNVDVIYA